MKKKLLTLLILVIFPLNVVAYSNFIIPGGTNIGIEVYNKGIMVIGFYKINNKFNTNDLKLGDIITYIENTRVYTVEDMIDAIEKNVNNNKINITVLRNKKEETYSFNLINKNGVYKTGLYVKDSISGIGTLTYIDPETKIYGALGHEIIESNSLTSVEVRTGSIFESEVTSIDRSSVGNAGTKNAKFYSNNKYGTVNKNTVSGIYGLYTKELPNIKPLEVGLAEDIKVGKATIYTVLEGEKIEEFEINITDINLKSEIKNISFEVIDERLKDKTGGIVQGMSGSPIIQDNKIFGAVTHVIINNPNTGYGIFITTMLEEGEKN